MQYQTRLDKVEASFVVLERYSGGQFGKDEDMGRHLLCSAHVHKEPHGRR
jgi:hypothetical protein